MSEQVVIDYVIEMDFAPETQRTLRQSYALLNRTASILRRMGLPENISKGISTFQQLITVANQARTSLLLLQAATGPIGWIMGGLGLVAAGITAGEMYYDGMRGR